MASPAGDALLAAIRAVHFAATIVVFGQFVYAWLVAPRREPPCFARITAWGMALALASALAWLGAEAVSMSGLPAKDALSGGVLGTVLAQTQFGQVWLARIAASAAVVAVLAGLRGTARAAAGTVLSASLVVALAAMGHGGSGRGVAGAVHLAADAVHLAAAGAWLGALVPLVLEARAAASGDEAKRRFAAEATRRFSTLGVASMALIVVTGVANSCYMLPSVSALVATPYGRWLYLKVALFLVIFFIAATNRLQVAPRLAAEGGPAFRRLTRNALAEAALGFAIVAIVGELGVTVPGSHMR